MGKPKKVLVLTQLKYLTEGAVDGSHEIRKVEFIEDGITKIGFYKKLAPNNGYPELLAKMSVAASVFKGLFQGQNTAEERLVYDKDDGRIVGSLSIEIKGFKPFNYWEEGIPTDPVLKEQLVPSAEKLIKNNAMDALFSRWFLDDDDPHPHNLGFVGDRTVDIDFDMFWYRFTIYMKGARPLIEMPKSLVNLTVNDWENFPHTPESLHYHGSTYSRPGQFSLSSGFPGEELVLGKVLPKSYAAPTEFLSLASSPVARKQLFSIALKALLTFNPDMVRQRLEEHFGSTAFNYTSLNEHDPNNILCKTYEETFPQYCTPETNVKPFVDFIMKLYQLRYDNLYRVVVFYMGCSENNYQMPLNPTYYELYSNPSFYKNTHTWMTQQNKLLGDDTPAIHYDLAVAERRYHQIWRDAFAPRLRDLLHGIYNLTKKLLQDGSSYDTNELCYKKSDDQTVTHVWDLFGIIPEFDLSKVDETINLDPDNGYRTAINLMVNFANSFRSITKKYYEKIPHDLVPNDSSTYVYELSSLNKKYEKDIREALLHTTSAAKEFNLIVSEIKQLISMADFEVHLLTTDEQIKDTGVSIFNKGSLSTTDANVIEQYVKSLFSWAKGLDSAELQQYIEDIVSSKYEKTLSKRYRAPHVRDYLAKSTNETGDNRLAYIFSSGSSESGELNMLLIEHLTPKMLEKYPIMSIRNAVRDENFNKNKLLYTTHVVRAAKEEPQFVHLFSKQGMKLFYAALYTWVKELPSEQFDELIKNALTEYQQGKSSYSWVLGGSVSRVNEVLGYKDYPQAKQVALIFLNGEKNSSLSLILFRKIVAAMNAETVNDIAQNPGRRLVKQFNSDTHAHIITDEHIKAHAEQPSHQQGTRNRTGSLFTPEL